MLLAVEPTQARSLRQHPSFCDLHSQSAGSSDDLVYLRWLSLAISAAMMVVFTFFILRDVYKKKMPQTTTMRIAKVPSELIPLILKEVESPSVLYNLLLVSRGVNYWAERALYHSLDVGPAPNHASRAFSTIATCPRIALHVRHVGIFGDPDLESIPWGAAFQAMTNLDSLAIYVTPSFLCVVEPGLGFRLRSFTYFGSREDEVNQWLSAFLAVQASLEQLQLYNLFLTRSASSIVLSAQALPKLAKLYAHPDDVRVILPGRFITHLSTYSGDNDIVEHVEGDVEGAGSVRSLRITNAGSLSLYRDCFPNLRFLEFASGDYGDMFKIILPHLNTMRLLEKIKAGVPERSQSANAVWDPTGNSSPLIYQTFSACPSLEKVEIFEGRWAVQGSQSSTWTRNPGLPMDTLWQIDEWMDV